MPENMLHYARQATVNGCSMPVKGTSMNTIIIYDQCGEKPLQFYSVEGDYSKFNNIYINRAAEDEDLQPELDALYEELDLFITGLEPMPMFPIALVMPETIVITCGFLP